MESLPEPITVAVWGGIAIEAFDPSYRRHEDVCRAYHEARPSRSQRTRTEKSSMNCAFVTQPSPARIPIACGILALLVLLPTSVAAQQGRTSLELRLGLGNPTQDLAGLHEEGLALGVGIAHRVRPRVELRLEGALENLEPGGGRSELGGAKGPDANAWHLVGGLGIELTDPTASEWEVTYFAQAGITYFDVDESETLPAQTATAPTLNSGLTVGYDIAKPLSLFVRMEAYLMLSDTSDPDDYLGKEITIVNSIGIRLSF